ncbi:unnamed protein product [Rotaria magnacalcarata]|uniref:Uncharacterized protein n=1 Tax=Rotaria magnacalcarata TaxID=392030 RepID=A0A816TSU5_9BILA|nr:unnamed protein product [Rotaria magnacalcarata]
MASSMSNAKMKEQPPKANEEKMSRKERYQQMRVQEAINTKRKNLQDAIDRNEPHNMHLGKMEIENADMETVVDQAIKKKQCTSLILEDNMITVDGITSIVDTLRRGASLKLLRLSGNPIGDDGADLLAELLHEKPDALTGLWLSNAALTNRGVQLLMEALEHPQSTLEILDLSDNKNVTDESVDSILEMFMVNKKLNNLRYANILSGKKQNHLKELYGGKVAFLTFSDNFRV